MCLAGYHQPLSVDTCPIGLVKQVALRTPLGRTERNLRSRPSRAYRRKQDKRDLGAHNPVVRRSRGGATGRGVERSIVAPSLALPASSHSLALTRLEMILPSANRDWNSWNSGTSASVSRAMAVSLSPFLGIASITCKRQARRICGAAVLFRHDMLQVEGNEGRGGLR